ncbi:MAG: carbohydrate ABC transporter permease [Treponema sp.]|jgi:multiple sugar transport system permease protein|nr:carbohydrate ABC transporter permease [Treponema sp.]
MSAFYQRLKRRESILDAAAFAGLIMITIIVVFPVWWIFRSSLMNNAELYAWPPKLLPQKWLFSNYAESLKSFPFWRYLVNTMLIIVPSVAAGTFTATLCGYAFARLRFPGKRILFSLCVGSMLLPTMVTLVPLYVMWTRGLHLVDSYWPLILPFFCGGGAFNIFLIRQFIYTIPRELDEAARIDGAGHWRILTRIIMPAIKPAMIVVALLLFILLWNDLLQQTVYINSTEKFTIAIGLTQFKGSLYSDWAKIMCATCMSFLPGVIIYLIGQRQFVEGIALTGMKN